MCAPAARRLVAGAAGLTRQFYLVVEAGQRTLSLDNVFAIANALSAAPRELSTQLPPSGLGPVRVSPGQRARPARRRPRPSHRRDRHIPRHRLARRTQPPDPQRRPPHPRPEAPRPADPRRNGSDPMADDRRKPRKSLPLKLSHPGQRPTHGSDPMAKDSPVPDKSARCQSIRPVRASLSTIRSEASSAGSTALGPSALCTARTRG